MGLVKITALLIEEEEQVKGTFFLGVPSSQISFSPAASNQLPQK